MARTGLLVLISWIMALSVISGARVYKIEREPLVTLSDFSNSFSKDIRDILDLLRMFISLIETANQRLGRVLKLQLESTTSPKNLETESLDVLLNRFEGACRSFRNRFFYFMETQATISRTEKASDDDVHERLSEFEHSVKNTYIDGLGSVNEPTASWRDFSTDDPEVDSKLETSDSSLTQMAKTSREHDETEDDRIVDESKNFFLKQESDKKADTSLLAKAKVTISDPSLEVLLTKEADETVKDDGTDLLTDDVEVTIEEEELSTEPLIDETLDTSSVSKILTDEDDATRRLNESLKLNFSPDSDSFQVISSLSAKETAKGNDLSENISNLKLGAEKINSELEFLHRFNFEESYQRPLLVSMIGAAGKHFPNYSQMPETSFTCDDKYIPGVYADIETKCQVFHVCWPHKIESFLCPIGTIFNQQTRSCDYWFSSACSLSTEHFGSNFNFLETLKPVNSETIYNSIILYKLNRQNSPTVSLIAEMKFLPIHFTVSDFSTKIHHFEDPDLNELQQLNSKSEKDLKFSKEEFELARKIYEELFRQPQNSESEKSGSSALESLSLKMKLHEQKKKYDTSSSKTDRSGLVEEIETTEVSNPGASEATHSDTLPTKLDTTDENVQPQTFSKKPSFKAKYPHPHEKNQMASEIVFETFKTVDKVLNQGILPLTREMLAINYSKLPKRKKL